MKLLSIIVKFFIGILIIIAGITVLLGLFALFRINKEFSGNIILMKLVLIEMTLQIAYLISSIGILKNKPWAWYSGVTFLGIGVIVRALNKDFGLATFYIIIVILLIITKFLNKKG